MLSERIGLDSLIGELINRTWTSLQRIGMERSTNWFFEELYEPWSSNEIKFWKKERGRNVKLLTWTMLFRILSAKPESSSLPFITIIHFHKPSPSNNSIKTRTVSVVNWLKTKPPNDSLFIHKLQSLPRTNSLKTASSRGIERSQCFRSRSLQLPRTNSLSLYLRIDSLKNIRVGYLAIILKLEVWFQLLFWLFFWDTCMIVYGVCWKFTSYEYTSKTGIWPSCCWAK